jgi:hypothetical protein
MDFQQAALETPIGPSMAIYFGNGISFKAGFITIFNL